MKEFCKNLFIVFSIFVMGAAFGLWISVKMAATQPAKWNHYVAIERFEEEEKAALNLTEQPKYKLAPPFGKQAEVKQGI